VLAALRATADKAPKPGGRDLGVNARVLGELIDRAAQQYRVASEQRAFEPYLDGYGFYLAAKVRSGDVLGRLPGPAAAAVSDALATLASAYPTVLRPPRPAVEPGSLLGKAARAKLALGSIH
jgi:hypothetical protein